MSGLLSMGALVAFLFGMLAAWLFAKVRGGGTKPAGG
jgi:hypothetical protein